MHILHICSHKWSLLSPAIFRPAIYGALKSKSDSQPESDRTIYAIENIGLIILKRPLKRAQVHLTLIDRRNHHLFQPLLYQVASAALNASDIAYPLRAALRRQKNARVLLANATAIDLIAKKVILDYGDLAYDYLVSADFHLY
jgi:NADH:ubiquinone reductase (H+-translocating)